MAVTAGMDFFIAEVLTWRGLVTYYVLFVIELETRRVTVAGVTRHPTEEWMEQVARNLIDSESGTLTDQRYTLHDRDTKFCSSFRSILQDGGMQALRLPARSPNLNAHAELWVRSVKQECLSKLILCSEPPSEELQLNMSCFTTRRGITKASKTCSYSPLRLTRVIREHRSFASSASAACLDTTTLGRHE